MTVTQNQLRRAITAFTAAAIDESWKGIDTSRAEAAERVRKLKHAHARLDRLLRALPIPLNPPRGTRSGLQQQAYEREKAREASKSPHQAPITTPRKSK